MEKEVTRGRSDEDQAKTTTLNLETGSKLSRVGYEECQAHKKNHTGIYWSMCLGDFRMKPFLKGTFQSEHNISS